MAVRRLFVTGDIPSVNARSALSNDQAELAGRAAHFRLEADVLRERARGSTERVIRDQYLALAERWSSFAAGLDAELMSRLSE